jgi:hypothetical protein
MKDKIILTIVFIFAVGVTWGINVLLIGWIG